MNKPDFTMFELIRIYAAVLVMHLGVALLPEHDRTKAAKGMFADAADDLIREIDETTDAR